MKTTRAIGAARDLTSKGRRRAGWICNACGNVTLEYRGTRLVGCLDPDCAGTDFDPCFVYTPGVAPSFADLVPGGAWGDGGG